MQQYIRCSVFNIDSKNPNLKCTVSGTYKGNVRTATQTIQLEAAKWYKLNIKPAPAAELTWEFRLTTP